MVANRRLSDGAKSRMASIVIWTVSLPDGEVDLNRCVSEVHLMAAAVATADEREAHLGPSLDVGDSSHSFSFDQRRSDCPPRTAIPIALR
jgi:hypothetical protein